jgi:nitrogen fixation-related uncharacterized protein
MKWSVLSTFLLFTSLTVMAEPYKAPDLKISMHPDHSGQVIKSGQWESEYKVEEKMLPDRELASEPEEEVKKSPKKRSPSSERKPSSKGKKPSIQPWPFDPTEE